ncbi:hypothetical protein Efla_001625 [Eimeria flavescens]
MESPHPPPEVDSQGRLKDPNLYRTSYLDMCLGREVCVKSDFPSGYGGHVPRVRHQLLFNDCAEVSLLRARRSDPERDSFGSFDANINGTPYLTIHAKPKAEGPQAGFFPPSLQQQQQQLARMQQQLCACGGPLEPRGPASHVFVHLHAAGVSCPNQNTPLPLSPCMRFSLCTRKSPKSTEAAAPARLQRPAPPASRQLASSQLGASS